MEQVGCFNIFFGKKYGHIFVVEYMAMEQKGEALGVMPVSRNAKVWGLIIHKLIWGEPYDKAYVFL